MNSSAILLFNLMLCIETGSSIGLNPARIAKEASATLRKEIRNAVSGFYSPGPGNMRRKLISLSRGRSDDQLHRRQLSSAVSGQGSVEMSQ